MSYSVRSIAVFEKQAKRLIKKYASLKKELLELVNQLKENPQQGTPIGNNCYKIRIAVASKGKGKSGGARIITNFIVTEEAVYLLTIYDKSEKENITDKELQQLLQYLPAGEGFGAGRRHSRRYRRQHLGRLRLAVRVMCWTFF